jgi:hypothetical protein
MAGPGGVVPFAIELHLRPGDMLRVSLRPGAERLDGLSERVPEPGQPVLDAWWYGRVLGPADVAIALQAAQCQSQHSVRDTADETLDLIEALGTIAQQNDDENAPLVAHACQDGTGGLTVYGSGVDQFDSHSSVPSYQWCAFLRVLSAEPILISVSIPYRIVHEQTAWRP